MSAIKASAFFSKHGSFDKIRSYPFRQSPINLRQGLTVKRAQKAWEATNMDELYTIFVRDFNNKSRCLPVTPRWSLGDLKSLIQVLALIGFEPRLVVYAILWDQETEAEAYFFSFVYMKVAQAILYTTAQNPTLQVRMHSMEICLLQESLGIRSREQVLLASSKPCLTGKDSWTLNELGIHPNTTLCISGRLRWA